MTSQRTIRDMDSSVLQVRSILPLSKRHFVSENKFSQKCSKSFNFLSWTEVMDSPKKCRGHCRRFVNNMTSQYGPANENRACQNQQIKSFQFAPFQPITNTSSDLVKVIKVSESRGLFVSPSVEVFLIFTIQRWQTWKNEFLRNKKMTDYCTEGKYSVL